MVLSNTAIRRPVTVLLCTFAVMAFGYMAFSGLGVDLFPEVDFPMVTVTAVLPGADPEIMDSDVTDVLEEQINTISGVKTINSTSREGMSQIIVEFVLTKDVDVAAQEIRDKINLAQADLPREMDPPIVDKLNITAQPIVWFAATTRGEYADLARYVDDILKERLQSVPGVGAITLTGFREREIRIWLDPVALESYDLAPADVARAVGEKHVEMPGGRIERPATELTVKVRGEYATVGELQSLVVFEKDGTVVRLKDVAQVADGSEDMRSTARFNGLPAVGLGVRKQSGTNTVAVARAVKAEVAKIAGEMPRGMGLELALDFSGFIESSMHDVIYDLFLGAALTCGVMILFLRNVRMTFISMMAIPTSIIGCFVAMYFMGFTINNMTMLAMSLAIGVVIDDAIVVLENIFRHVEEKGERPLAAAQRGTSEVAFAVMAASLAIMAVFVPVAFMQGIIGRFFFQFGVVVSISVLISIVVSFTLTPMLCSRLLRHNPNPGVFFGMLERAFRAVESFYARWLDRALRFRWVTLALAAGLFVVGMMLVPLTRQEFVTEPDQGQFMVRFEFPTGTSVPRTGEGMRTIEKVLLSQPEVRSAFATTGLEGADVNSGMVYVTMASRGERATSQEEMILRMRETLAKAAPDARLAVESVPIVGGGLRDSDIQFVVQGPNVNDLEKVSAAIMADVRATRGFVDIDNDLRMNKPQVDVAINRDLADSLGVSTASIAQTYNILFGGLDVAKFKENGKQYDIRLRALPDSRREPDQLNEIVVRSNRGELIRSSNLVSTDQGYGPNSIHRYNRRRSVTIYANTVGDLGLNTALAVVRDSAKRHIPNEAGWSTGLLGGAEAFEESFRNLLIALIISILLIYVILGSQFESFIHPFTVLLSVPLAVVGGIGLLLILNKPLDIFSFIGFIMLVGIVTRNSILLVDFTNQARARGVPREEALRQAGPLRFRPILMTSMTVMASMIPLVLALTEGSEMRTSMGTAVFGGMVTSTLLTLIVIPCAYSAMDDFGRLLARFWHSEAVHDIEERAEEDETLSGAEPV